MADLDLTRREFTRQAEPMSRSSAFTGERAVAPFARLLGAPLPSPLLDLACGPGIVSAALAAAGTDVIGADATPAMLGTARARCEAAGLANVGFQTRSRRPSRPVDARSCSRR